MERINNFRYPISQPTVFDEEEMTILDLTSKNAYKTNEIIDWINTTLEGVMTNKIREMISKGFIDGVYIPETETLLLKFTYPDDK